ncbi:3-phosphoserine/phosphohydroxythreonine transaminase [Rhodohalobacter barkolensis]|uniref:Phosphoserine aminotransferase n=1 Tax=Rhodohalobacter barkolensis TaxID=2053187 RepID=A0A2N0VM56_9BACT|nr:3-phosphoserine/phosphohydroxythreonine transaminase [Rhodohalobacter barkolensis]PKD45297.1 3-phosphoserine/phosphohydroxythreonine transaminase [Rhodohalobacter barkolensis]
MKRVHNFSAGPATLPLSVLEKVQNELIDYKEKGASIIEMSHRSPEYTEVNRQAVERVKEITGADDDWEVLFLQGGASSQFMMVAHNFLNMDRTANYIDTGTWSAKAIKEAKLFGNVHTSFSGKEGAYGHIPTNDELTFAEEAIYTHFTSNNTVAGTQFAAEPKSSSPLVCDASSDFLSHSLDLDKFGLIYAGAQKNVGPAGVTVVMIRKSFLEKQRSEAIPTILNYKTHVEKLFNTPPVFAVYILNYVLEWIQEKGGLSYFEKFSNEKSGLIYSEIDQDDFYRGTVEKEARSKMNITFRLPSEDLEKKFISEAASQNLMNLKGHRSVGGIRASIYNACEMDSVKALVDFMGEFRSKNG